MSIEKLQSARAEAHLSKLIRFRGEVCTYKSMALKLLDMGAIFRAVQVPKVKPMSRMAFFRADNRQQAAHEKRRREAGTKTVYEAHLPDGSIFDITKTQYDFIHAYSENLQA